MVVGNYIINVHQEENRLLCFEILEFFSNVGRWMASIEFSWNSFVQRFLIQTTDALNVDGLSTFSVEFIPRRFTMDTFRGTKRVIALIGMSDTDFAQIGNKQVPKAIIRYLLTFIFFINIVIQSTFCMQALENGVHTLLLPFHLASSFTAFYILFKNLLWNEELILDLFEHVERIVCRSKLTLQVSSVSRQKVDRIS